MGAQGPVVFAGTPGFDLLFQPPQPGAGHIQSRQAGAEQFHQFQILLNIAGAGQTAFQAAVAPVQHLAHLVGVPDQGQSIPNQGLQGFAVRDFQDQLCPVGQHRRFAAEKLLQMQVGNAAVAFPSDADHLVQLQSVDESGVRQGAAFRRGIPGGEQKAEWFVGHDAYPFLKVKNIASIYLRNPISSIHIAPPRWTFGRACGTISTELQLCAIAPAV